MSKNLEPEKKYIESLVVLMEVLANIDTEGITAKLNETTINDNNGGRIEL